MQKKARELIKLIYSIIYLRVKDQTQREKIFEDMGALFKELEGK